MNTKIFFLIITEKVNKASVFLAVLNEIFNVWIKLLLFYCIKL